MLVSSVCLVCPAPSAADGPPGACACGRHAAGLLRHLPGCLVRRATFSSSLLLFLLFFSFFSSCLLLFLLFFFVFCWQSFRSASNLISGAFRPAFNLISGLFRSSFAGSPRGKQSRRTGRKTSRRRRPPRCRCGRTNTAYVVIPLNTNVKYTRSFAKTGSGRTNATK
jgi:hypothetical protein